MFLSFRDKCQGKKYVSIDKRATTTMKEKNPKECISHKITQYVITMWNLTYKLIVNILAGFSTDRLKSVLAVLLQSYVTFVWKLQLI